MSAAGLAVLMAAPGLGARTIEVGAGREVRTIGEAAGMVQPGDTVLIDAGTYREAVRWRGGSVTAAPVTVRGAPGGGTIIDGQGVDLSGVGKIPRALFQVEGDNFVFENLEFRNARNGRNGSAFRFLNSKTTVVRQCRIFWCDMGLMSTGNDGLLVEDSEIAYNGTYEYNGYSHNFYLAGGKTTVRFCYIHDAISGQNFKTRGRYTELLYNYIADAHDGIDGGVATKEIGIQDGVDAVLAEAHAVLVGNVVVKSGNGPEFLDFGPERWIPPRNGVLYLINNTFIREGAPRHAALRLGHPSQQAVLWNNIFLGFANVSTGFGRGNLRGSDNWVPAAVPLKLPHTFHGDDAGMVNLPGRDYRLLPDSPAAGHGTAAVFYQGPAGERRTELPDSAYHPARGATPRVIGGRIGLGAYEAAAAGAVPVRVRRGWSSHIRTGGFRIRGVAAAPWWSFQPAVAYAEGPVSASARVEQGGFELRGLPAGKYEVRVRGAVERHWTVEVDSDTVVR